MVGDTHETDVLVWVLQPFEPLFAKLAPSPAPGSVEVTLSDYFLPEFFVSVLDVVDEELLPRRLEVKLSPYVPPGVWLDEDFLDDLETWTPPRKVLIDNGQTACFFEPCYSVFEPITELRAYKKITAANLDPQLHICRLHGVVMDDAGRVPGLLLSYIDHSGLTMSCLVGPDEPSASVRARWASQLSTALAELHKAGIVWGDVKAENVLVDQDDNAWITDFGGGYTEGWVGKEVAGTVEGDLEGMVRLREFIFQDKAQDPGDRL
ncbi:uncharacterized protein DNG_09396 [Cephalotrichum gorgonifer]|uniref:Protein kinase domain-containing protein n=1 Tax=Cephalotrichum gorgonifer TaxID=2041049 RepID=A0AAE8N865_9PEZI|nr:uncharacterized protein DNG_09396 [Cephalotrichum gorgonifer]